jgi:hypothetical protein
MRGYEQAKAFAIQEHRPPDPGSQESGSKWRTSIPLLG